MTVTPTDLGTYLGAAVDDQRAKLVIWAATQLCQGIVNPLPEAADIVVLDVAARGYTNPQNMTSQAVGPFSANYNNSSGGLWLTRANKAALRRMSGSGGAFTIDTMPATAGADLPWWDRGGWNFSDMSGGGWDTP